MVALYRGGRQAEALEGLSRRASGAPRARARAEPRGARARTGHPPPGSGARRPGGGASADTSRDDAGGAPATRRVGLRWPLGPARGARRAPRERGRRQREVGASRGRARVLASPASPTSSSGAGAGGGGAKTLVGPLLGSWGGHPRTGLGCTPCDRASRTTPRGGQRRCGSSSATARRTSRRSCPISARATAGASRAVARRA